MKRFLYLAIAFLTVGFTTPAWSSNRAGDGLTHPSFEGWLVAFRKEAEVKGIPSATLERALAQVEFLPRVIDLDRKQPEFTLTLDEYLARVVNDRRVRLGRKKLRDQGPLLRRVSARYGVPPRFLVALWGIETDYGRLTGGFNALSALATLAYDGRRARYFRRELLNALRIIDAGHVAPEAMTGSWAGALGQVQFMPSTFVGYAVDGDDDGHIDLWESLDDVFVSAANYLSRMGWNPRYTWGREVRLPNGAEVATWIGAKKTLRAWADLGVRRADGTPLPVVAGMEAKLIRPDGEGGRAFLTYANYDVLLKWNRADKFAIAVGILADRLVERR